MVLEFLTNNLPIIIGMGVLLVIIALGIKIVRPTERGIIERLGKYNRYADPGLNMIIPVVENIFYINVTEQMVDAQKQDVITKDNLNCNVDAQIYFKVKNDELSVKKSQYHVDNYLVQIVALTRTTLRDIIGKHPFKDVNNQRDKLNDGLERELEKQTDAWGIQVVRAEIKEIEPPKDVQDTMNEVIKAENEKIAAEDFATATETVADGKKRAAIKSAEGDRRSIVLRAEGEKQRQELVATGKAEAIRKVNISADKYFVGNAVEYEKLQKLQKTLEKNTKFVIPSDSPLMDVVSAMLGVESTKDKKK